MRKRILLTCMALLSEGAMAFESGQLSLDTPNVLKKSEGSFGIRHRFYGEASDYENFLGTDDGGNMHFTFKYAVLDNVVIGCRPYKRPKCIWSRCRICKRFCSVWKCRHTSQYI